MPTTEKTNLNSVSQVTYLLERNIHKSPPAVESSAGNYIYLTNGQKIFDATCGAAVSCLGHGNKEVQEAMIGQMAKNSYVASVFFSSPVVDALAQELIEGTNERMARAFLIGSGEHIICCLSNVYSPFNVRFRGHGSRYETLSAVFP